MKQAAVTIALCLGLGQGQEEVEKRLKDLEAGRAAQEKRIAELEKAPPDLAGKIKALEARLAESEKASDRLKGVEARLAEAEKSASRLEARLSDSEKLRQALEKRAADALRDQEAARIDLAKRLSDAEKARDLIEKRLADQEKGRQDLVAALRDQEAARIDLAKRLAEAEKAAPAVLKEVERVHGRLHDELANATRAQDTARAALEKQLTETTHGLRGALESSNFDLSRRVAEIERDARAQLRRLALAEGMGREGLAAWRQVAADLRGVKLNLLFTHYGGEGVPGGFVYPFERHFPALGIEADYLVPERSRSLGLRQGEGMKVLRVGYDGPAHGAGIEVGDYLLRVNGEPVRRSGLKGERLVGDRWSPRDLRPSYATAFLPGDEVQVELSRGGEAMRFPLRLACRACGDGCPFGGMER